MDDKLSKILKIIAVTGIVTAGVAAFVKTDMFKDMLSKCINEFKKRTKCFDPNEKYRLIAKQINRDIQNTERKISDRYHDKNQQIYSKMDWGSDIISRSDISRN